MMKETNMLKNMTNRDVRELLHLILYRACYDGALSIVEFLLHQGLNVDGVDEDGDFVEGYKGEALYGAVEGGNPDVVKLLLETGSNPNLHNDDGRLPLVGSSVSGDEEMARLLLDH